MEPLPLPVRRDPRDGGPGWDPSPGTPLLPGLLAWHRLVVGRRRETWLCWSVPLWQPALVKVVRPDWQRPTSTRALAREVRALRGLEHPGFPRLFADGTRSALPHLVMEYLNGPALDEELDDGRLSARSVANVGVDVLAALRYLHASGKAHLDICPDNVVTVDCRSRLIDLGAARRLGSALEPGERFGTAGFQAPELDGWPGGPVTAAMDLYSVGATLRRALEPGTDETGAVSEVIVRLTDPDPGRRPTPEAALALLVRAAGSRGSRPWPWWADRHLRPPRRARGTAGPPDGRPRDGMAAASATG